MPWIDTPLARRLGLRLPIVQARMAGGCSTPQLRAAVSAAGGLGSLAGAMIRPDDLRDQIGQVRALTGQPFAVNLFAPLPPPSGEFAAEWAQLTGVAPKQLPPAIPFEEQLAVVVTFSDLRCAIRRGR